MADPSILSLYSSHMAHTAGVYPSFATRLPPAFHQAPAGWRGTARGESFAQLQHIDQTKSRAQTSGHEVQRTNH